MPGQPWENDPIVKPAAPSGGGLVVEPLPAKPSEPKTTFRTLAPGEVQQQGLNPTHAYQVSSEGKVDDLGELPAGTTPDKPNPNRRAEIETILANIRHARDLSRKPFAVGNMAGNQYFQDIPFLGQNAADLAGALEMTQGDLIQQARAELLKQGINIGSRGADTEKEAARLAASKANLSQSQSFDEFTTGLDRAEEFYKRALADTPGQQSAMQQPDAGLPQLQISTTSQAVEPTPEQKAAADKLGAMVAKGLPLNNILLYAKNNGLDALQSNLREIVTARGNSNSTVSKWLKQNPGKAYPVSLQPYNEPLDGTDKLRAEAAGGTVGGVSPGAAVASAADTGSFGLAPELAGAVGALTGNGYGDSRANFIKRQELLSAENPGSTFAGGLLGGLTSLGVADAPTGLMSLVKQGGTYGLVHGAASSEDPSIAGRFGNALAEGATGAALPLAIDPALRGVVKVGGGFGRTARRLMGENPETLADEAALASLPGRIPEQDTAAAKLRIAEQTRLGAEPSAATAMDRAGQDYLGRVAQTSPQARQAADQAVTRAEQSLPGQLADDFTQAIDAAAGNKEVSSFLKRPAREITGDIQDMAGREFEGAVKPIYHEPIQPDAELLTVLSDEQTPAAIRDALRQPGVTPETKAILRALPQKLKAAESVMDTSATANLGPAAAAQVAQAQAHARDAVMKDVGLNVEAMWRIRSAMQRRARKMTPGEPAGIALSDLAKSIGEKVGDFYPEWADANSLYSSRMRAIDALDSARDAFLSNTDEIAKQAGRNSNERGQPGTRLDNAGQPIPSEAEMAMAGAREAVGDASGKTTTSGVTTGRNLNAAGQRERNALVFGNDAASNLEKRAGAKVENVETLRRLRSGGTGDAAENRVHAGMQAAADVGRGWPIAGMTAAIRAIRGVSPEEAGRIVKLYTTPDKADALLADLEKRYGQRKARFIIGRLGTIATTNQVTRAKPGDEQ